jgi:hypothetical protein
MSLSEKKIAKKSNYSPPFMGGVRGWVFLKRLRHCAGFGIQSPTDYAFVREVIYERWPYALYAELEAKFYGTNSFLLKLSQLLLRVSNYAQASRIGIIGTLPPVMEAHLKAGCRKSETVQIVKSQKSKVKSQEYEASDFSHSSLAFCPPPLVIATELNEQWQAYISQEHIISFDLYYLGIAFYDEKRYREEHVVNFY